MFARPGCRESCLFARRRVIALSVATVAQCAAVFQHIVFLIVCVTAPLGQLELEIIVGRNAELLWLALGLLHHSSPSHWNDCLCVIRVH